MTAGINRTTSSATARATRPAALFAIVPNEAQAMAHVCRARVVKPNFRRTSGTEILRITLHGDPVESGHG